MGKSLITSGPGTSIFTLERLPAACKQIFTVEVVKKYFECLISLIYHYYYHCTSILPTFVNLIKYGIEILFFVCKMSYHRKNQNMHKTQTIKILIDLLGSIHYNYHLRKNIGVYRRYRTACVCCINSEKSLTTST